jgi:hypothetical protein
MRARPRHCAVHAPAVHDAASASIAANRVGVVVCCMWFVHGRRALLLRPPNLSSMCWADIDLRPAVQDIVASSPGVLHTYSLPQHAQQRLQHSNVIGRGTDVTGSTAAPAFKSRHTPACCVRTPRKLKIVLPCFCVSLAYL